MQLDATAGYTAVDAETIAWTPLAPPSAWTFSSRCIAVAARTFWVSVAPGGVVGDVGDPGVLRRSWSRTAA